jgi:periplasmic nitrate reductase NapE
MSARTTEDMLMERAREEEHGDQRKKEEFRTWLFLALIMAPVLAVLIVSAYGFGVWFFQLIAGPPS